MTDSLMLDSAGVRAVIATVVKASVAASHVRPTNVSDTCVTRDFRDYVGDLESTWRDESLATGEYLHEFARAAVEGFGNWRQIYGVMNPVN